MDTITEVEALVILSHIHGLGPAKTRLLLQHFTTAQNALEASPNEIAALPGFSKIASQWNSWHQDFSWQKDLELAAKYNVTLLPYYSPRYPKRLKGIHDAPLLLYVQGEILPEDERSIAIIGTRNATIYGNEMAAYIARDLAAANWSVVSGLARGIDTAAHHGALSQGRTLAVIGSGLSNIYPQENRPLAAAIASQGAVISEFSMATAPDRHHFPRRNRIVSGMTLATLLIEAPLKSGAMITVDLALSQKRKVFVLPGRADHENFRGNHHCLKKGQAILVENAHDIMTHLQEEASLHQSHTGKPLNSSTPVQPSLSAEEQRLLSLMPAEEVNIEQLISLSCLPVQEVQRLLMGLSLKKIIKEFPGKIYKKKL